MICCKNFCKCHNRTIIMIIKRRAYYQFQFTEAFPINFFLCKSADLLLYINFTDIFKNPVAIIVSGTLETNTCSNALCMSSVIKLSLRQKSFEHHSKMK
jgi:hypothetical protein